ncbi:MAG: tetratricopeptide repeat protein [Candidatus Thorarchaeota archaeon]
MGLKEFYRLLDQGLMTQAFQEAASLSGDQRSEAQIVKAMFIVLNGSVDQANSIIEDVLTRILDNSYLHTLALLAKFWVLMLQAKYKEGWAEYQRVELLLTKLPPGDHNIKSKIFRPKFLLGIAKYMKAVYSISKGNNDEVSELYFQALEVAEEEDFPLKSLKIEIFNDLGVLAERRGDWALATDFYERILDVCDQLNNAPFKSHAYMLLGRMYQRQGNLDRASEYYHQALDLAKQHEFTLYLARIKKALGTLYHARGDQKQAKQNYLDSLALLKQTPVKAFADQTEPKYRLLLLALDVNDRAQAHEHLKLLQADQSDNPDLMTTLYCKMAEAQFLKASQRFKDKAKAQDLLREIFKDENTLHHMKFTAMLHLCDLLLQEFSLLGDKDLFTEAQALALQAGDLAQSWQFIPDMIRIQLLQAKFKLVKGDAQDAFQLLTQAAEVAEKKGLGYLLAEVKEEQNRLEKQLSEWKDLSDRNAPLQERIAFSEVEAYLQEAIKLRDLTPSLH